MNAPLLWNTLDEAADWLSDKTGSKWNREKIISFSIEHYRDENLAAKKLHSSRLYELQNGVRICKKPPVFSKEDLAIRLLPSSSTYLSAKLPKSAKVSLFKYRNDIKQQLQDKYESVAGGLLRIFSNVSIPFASLYPKAVREIFLYGETDISMTSFRFMPEYGGWEFELFEPIKQLTPEEVESIEGYSMACHGYLPSDAVEELGGACRISIDMIGIDKKNLEKLLAEYQKTHVPVANNIAASNKKELIDGETVSPERRKLSPAQQDKAAFQGLARALWAKNPGYIKRQVLEFDELKPYVKKYLGKNTLSDWLRDVDPRPIEKRGGRPRKTPVILENNLS
ncbi:hypothetical protein [Nitrosomonas sp.]|uniref:hypothetical protein n=1 Tax=Nitrosomonas sp. TaxID=42353 RepID=UPI002730F343|nr:hypothetical protein [Nitrosomonas sp.]MDP2225673.1 hypothetical protein [Nitrosomonas sp.]